MAMPEARSMAVEEVESSTADGASSRNPAKGQRERESEWGEEVEGLKAVLVRSLSRRRDGQRRRTTRRACRPLMASEEGPA